MSKATPHNVNKPMKNHVILSWINISYQTQGKVEQSCAAVEQDGEESGRGGDEEADISAHYHPQRLQYLQDNEATANMSSTGKPHTPLRHRVVNISTIYELQLL